ncbi:hypothetical protein ACJ72_06498 [Emergomyces africanus]|uniref:Uncharacterized protein n=1 Tax=Emergomyces africanus TaxID=1955775 RepID=A0A1B7NQT9_9EURO|nr:hypothetical protein ACJ72_06498 [Emergomyces africanus]
MTANIVPGISEATAKPSSPEETRRMLKESDQAKGEMTIERYLYVTDPYRASSHPNPLPFPVHCEEEPDLLPPDQQADILDLLAAHGFTGVPEILLENITKLGYSPAGNIAVKTLRILYNASPSTLGDFSSAATSIRENFVSRGLQDIHVDIVHRDLSYKPSLFPISPTDPTTAIYERIKPELLEILKGSLGSSWKLMSLFQVGRTQETALPTVIILVQPMKTHDWAGLQRAMRTILDKHGSDYISLCCEFLPGSFPEYEYTETSYQHTGETGISQLGTISDECKVEMGFSNSATWKGILTNHHVATPLAKTPSSSRIAALANTFGFSPPEDDGTAVELQLFAGGDVEATKQHIDMRVHNLEELFSDYTNRQDRLTLNKAQPSAFSHLQTAILDTQTSLEKALRIQSFIEDMPLRVGDVLLSSGNLLYRDKIHDWAFVELSNSNGTITAADASSDSDPDSASVSVAQFQPNYMPPVPPNHSPTQYGFEFDLGPPSLRWPLATFGKLQPGKYYIKQGRSTGVTGGVCNGVLAVCNWSLRSGGDGDCDEEGRGHRVLYDEFGNQANYDPQNPNTATCTTTEEYVILSKGRCAGDYTTYTQSSFCEPGDDGSFIIGSDGSVCGLLYGTVATLCSGGVAAGRGFFYPGAGLATCFSNIIESLELRTRATDSEGNPVGAPAVFELPGLTE